MHVLFICDEYPPALAGGIGTSVASLARGLVQAGHRASVLGFYDVAESRIEEDIGVKVYRLRSARLFRGVTWFWLRLKLRTEILRLHARQPIDVIEWPDYGGWCIRPLSRIPNVLKVHGSHISHRIHGFGCRNRRYEWAELRMMRQMKNWIGVSKWFNEEWKSYSQATPTREEIVYNPVNIEVFKPGEERDGNTVLYAGGLKRRKGVGSLASAARIFLDENPKARLLMATFEADLKRADVLQAAGPTVVGRIEFLPFMSQAQLAQAMRRAAVFAMPSLYESCGNGWIEAMASGIPVVGSKAACGPEIVADGETGFVVDPEDPVGIAGHVTALLRNRELRERLGLAGRRCALERFSVEVGVRKSMDFYRRCVADQRNRSRRVA